MDFKTYLKTVPQQLDQQLNDYLAEWRKEALNISPAFKDLIDEFILSCQGGKRLRGALVELGYQIAGGEKDNPDILKASIAFEIFQTAILSHDDVIDQSKTRRGRDTIYQALGGDHYGVSQAICLGDVGFFLAAKIITQTSFPPENINKALQSFSQTMLDTALGEMLDVEIPAKSKLKTAEDVITIARLKTARYTIIGPLHLGAILAGANQSLLDKLTQFGDALGIAFQIQDDILGVFGDEKTLGKSVTSDIEEGKNTLLYTYAFDHSTPQQKQILAQTYGQGSINNDQLEALKQLFIETKSFEYSQSQALEYTNKAQSIIPQLTSDSTMQSLLSDFCDYLIKRQN